MRLELDPTVTSAAVQTDHAPSDAGVAHEADVLLKKGISAAQSGDRELARRLLNDAIRADAACSDAWMWLASIAEYPEELMACLDHVLEIEPENPRAVEWRAATQTLLAKTFVQRAAAAHQAGDSDGAADFVEQALSHDRDCETAWFWKATLAAEDDMKVEFLRRVLSINPENTGASAMLRDIVETRISARLVDAKRAAVAGKNVEALEMLDQVLDRDSKNIEAWMLRSHLSNDVADKLHSLETVLSIDPDHAAARAGYEFLSSAIAIEAEEPAIIEEFFEPEVEVSTPYEEPVVAATETESDISIPEAAADVQEIDEPEMSESIDPFKTIVGVNVGELLPAPPVIEAPAEEYSDVLDAAEIVEAEAEDQSSNGVLVLGEDRFDADPVMEPVMEVAEEIQEVTPSGEPLADEVAVAEVFEMAQEAYSEPAIDQAMADGFSDDALHVTEDPYDEAANGDSPKSVAGVPCPFCWENNEPLAFSCKNCNAGLSLEDIEYLISNPDADRAAILTAVTQMEGEWNLREFAAEELIWLGIGHLNLGNHTQAVNYLHEALMLRTNDVILAGQINTLQIRLDELRRQQEIDDARPKGRTILVVDDSATVRKLIAGKLEKSGHTVICAEDGAQGLTEIEQQRPDLVLLDITMPNMDGYEVCRQIRSNPDSKDIPVVMISGKDGFFDKVRGRMAGSTAYITKPFGPETLMKALETYLLPEGASPEAMIVDDFEDEPVAV